MPKRLIPVFVLGLALLGCRNQSLVGKWKFENPPIAGVQSPVVDFQEGGLMVVKGKMGSGYLSTEFGANGSWTLSGSKLTVKFQKLNLENLPDELREMIETQLQDQMNQLSGPLTWIDGNTIEVGESPNNYRLLRQK